MHFTLRSVFLPTSLFVATSALPHDDGLIEGLKSEMAKRLNGTSEEPDCVDCDPVAYSVCCTVACSICECVSCDVSTRSQWVC